MEKPNLSFWKLWNLSFGFFGVQIAYALQSANISRIFATLGADPHDLSYFWILPPLMGILVQPIVGIFSDKTWCRFGRRIPYLFVGAAVAVVVMCMLPNAGSFGMAVSAAMIFGVVALIFLDTSINMAMQPFKMLVGDMVNEKQKSLAYSIQSFLCNAGSLVGFVAPFILTYVGIKNVAAKGVVPDSVIWSFYIGAAILILCVIYTSVKVKEWPPKLYNQYNPVKTDESKVKSEPWYKLLTKAPMTFWKVGLVQFFCWVAFLYMWNYTTGSVAEVVWGVDATATETKEYQDAGDWVGILFAVQAIGSVLWAMVLPQFKKMKPAYAISLIIGGIGFVSVPLLGAMSIGVISGKYLLFVSFLLIGVAWAAMLSMPFALVTNSLAGYGHMGTYLGLFNGTICIPQIVAALLGGTILSLVGSLQSNMLIVAGISLCIGALCVAFIKEKK